MNDKLNLTSRELLETVGELMRGEGGFDPDQPVVLSCGGIHLKDRKLPKDIASWKGQMYLPTPDRSQVRTIRMKGETRKQSLKRIIGMESLN